MSRESLIGADFEKQQDRPTRPKCKDRHGKRESTKGDISLAWRHYGSWECADSVLAFVRRLLTFPVQGQTWVQV